MPHECSFFREMVIPHFDGQPSLEHVEQRRRSLTGSVDIASRNTGGNPSARAPGEGKDAGRMLGQGIERDLRASARMIHSSACDERGNVAVALARLGQQHEVGGLVVDREGEFAPDDPTDCRLTCALRKAHRTSQVVVIGQRQGRHA